MNPLDRAVVLEVGTDVHIVQPEEGVLAPVVDDPGHMVGLLGCLGILEIWFQILHYNNPIIILLL